MVRNVQEGSPVLAARVRTPWRVAMIPAWVAAGVAAGFAVVSVNAGWQQAGGEQHPGAQGWGVVAAAVLAVWTVLALVLAAGRGEGLEDDRWRVLSVSAAAVVLVVLAVTVAVAIRSWTSDQLLPGFGGAAGLVSVVAAAAAGVLALWALVAWRVLRRVIFAAGVAVAVAAAGVTAVVATDRWGSLSVDATTTAAVAVPAGQVAAAPSHVLWARMPPGLMTGSQVAVAGGLVIAPAAAGDRGGAEALDTATGQVRWRYLRADDAAGPIVVTSAQVVGLFWEGLPAVFLDARTGRPEPLTQLSGGMLRGAVDRAMVGTAFVQAGALRRSGEIEAASAVTGQRLWAERVPDCPFFSSGENWSGWDPGIVQAGHVIAVLYGCQRSLELDAAVTVHLALFGPGGSRKDVTIGKTSPGGGLLGAGLTTAGSTVLVRAREAGGDNPDLTAVSAATGAVLWRKHDAAVDALTGTGQVILDTPLSGSACGRYAVVSAQLLAAYPASICSALVSLDPLTAAHGRVYVPEAGRTDSDLQVTAIDVSDGAILGTPAAMKLPAGIRASDFNSDAVARADGSTLVISGYADLVAVQ